MTNSTDEARRAEPSKFEAWVREYGIQRLVADMRAKGHSVTQSAVYYWIAGRYEPRGPKVRDMVALSGGAITFEDVNEHFHKPAEAAR